MCATPPRSTPWSARWCAITGRLDVLLTTPAVNLRKRLLDYSDEEFDRVIELNLKGTFRVARACARPMMEKNAAASF